MSFLWLLCKTFLKYLLIFFGKIYPKVETLLNIAYFVECALKCVWNILSVMIWDMKLWFHLNIQNWCVNWDGSSKVYQTLPIIQLCYMNLYFTFENKVALEKKDGEHLVHFFALSSPPMKAGQRAWKRFKRKKKQPRPSVLFSF